VFLCSDALRKSTRSYRGKLWWEVPPGQDPSYYFRLQAHAERMNCENHRTVCCNNASPSGRAPASATEQDQEVTLIWHVPPRRELSRRRTRLSTPKAGEHLRWRNRSDTVLTPPGQLFKYWFKSRLPSTSTLPFSTPPAPFK